MHLPAPAMTYGLWTTTVMAIPAVRGTTRTSLAARETGRQKLNFFGTSSGGLRAATYAQAQPERIERLILSAFTYKGNGAAEIARRQQRIAELRANPRRKRDAAMIRSIFTRDGHASAYDPAVAEAI